MVRSLPYESDFVRRRYNHLAPFYVLFEWILWLPGGIRERAVQLLGLGLGERVLEVGCGTGRNLSFLRAAVGPQGHVYGVDLSEGMLSRCRLLCRHRRWENVTLVRANALDYTPPEPVDAVLLSLSYGVMQNRVQILEHDWSQLRPGGRLVIMDARLTPGIAGRLYRPFVVPLMKATVLGDPDHDAVRDLTALAGEIHLEERMFGRYFICRGIKLAA
jgi:ubiquinone/menaquinone biosynthesis C-methylase UbiE